MTCASARYIALVIWYGICDGRIRTWLQAVARAVRATSAGHKPSRSLKFHNHGLWESMLTNLTIHLYDLCVGELILKCKSGSGCIQPSRAFFVIVKLQTLRGFLSSSSHHRYQLQIYSSNMKEWSPRPHPHCNYSVFKSRCSINFKSGLECWGWRRNLTETDTKILFVQHQMKINCLIRWEACILYQKGKHYIYQIG